MVHKSKIRDACNWQNITRTSSLSTVSVEQVRLLLRITEVPCSSLEPEIDRSEVSPGSHKSLRARGGIVLRIRP
jgi:hypothetical protein